MMKKFVTLLFVLLPFALSSFTANTEDSPQQDEAFDYIKDRQFKVSHFNTIDPKADQYPELNPYLYCTGNPLTYVDPTGMKVYKNAQQLYDKGMEAINNEKFQPGYNGSTHCNQAAQYINGNDESFVGLANKMGNDLRNKPDFATSISPEEAQSYANQGVTVFVSWINEEGGHGHIAVVAPGKMSYSTSAGKKVVNIFNVGADNGLMKVTDGFGNRHVEYFILNSDLETIQTYTCGELQEITVVEKANIPEYKCYVTVPQLEKPNLNELLPSIK